MPHHAEGKEENQNWSMRETILIVDHLKIIICIVIVVSLIYLIETKYHIKML